MPIATILLLGVVVAATVTDVAVGKIHNWLTYPAIALGFALIIATGGDELLSSAVAVVLACVGGYVLRRAGAIGGGDIKLIAVIGAFKGLSFMAACLFYSLAAAAIMGIALLAWRGKLVDGVRWIFVSAASRRLPAHRPDHGLTTMPFAPAILIGTLCIAYLEFRTGTVDFSWWVGAGAVPHA